MHKKDGDQDLGVAAEAEPDRWQVLDATHIRAIFDLRQLPHGLYDVSVINPDGETVTEAARYLVERGIEADVTIGIGGPRNLAPGGGGTHSVSLQSLTNVDSRPKEKSLAEQTGLAVRREK